MLEQERPVLEYALNSDQSSRDIFLNFVQEFFYWRSNNKNVYFLK